MPALTLPTLAEDTIDDLLYDARTSALPDLSLTISILAKTTETTPQNIILAAIDTESGNNLLHMAGANGHVGTYPSPTLSSDTSKVNVSLDTDVAVDVDILKYLLAPTPLATTPPNNVLLNAQNEAGNTPLHWAAMNGHLEAVKLLVDAGADVGVRNNVGKDAAVEAETGEREEVVGWLMGRECGKGNEEGEGAVRADEDRIKDEMDAEEEDEAMKAAENKDMGLS